MAPMTSIKTMWTISVIAAIVLAVLFVAFLIFLIWVLYRLVKNSEVRKERAAICRSLAEVLKEQRLKNHMTQEFVAEKLGVSRQAVSKWENGSSDPSTSNLIALARLYGVNAAELLNGIK